MTSKDVLNLYNLLKENGITIWVDGGWCVDALLGKQTREHSDLDIALQRSDNTRLRQLLEGRGFKEEKRSDSSQWMYVLQNDDSQIDVHVFEYDAAGNNIYGTDYPYGSLTGRGTIDSEEVNCIASEWIYKFKTAYEPKEKDLKDVRALSKRFGYPLPKRYEAT